MNDTVERTLYIILLLVFVGVGIAIYVAISFGAKLDQQLKDAAEQRRAQQASLNQLKQDNAQQTAYIKCLLTAQNLGGYNTTCAPPSAISSTPATNGGASNGSANDSPPRAAGGGSAGSNPAPSPTPGVVQTLNNVLKKIGL